MKRLIRKEDNVSGVISVEAVKEDKLSQREHGPGNQK